MAQTIVTPALTKALETGLTTAIGSGIAEFLKKRAVHADILFSHSQNSGDMALFFPLGIKDDRSSKIWAYVKNLIDKGQVIEIRNCLSISGVGVEFNEDLKALGAIRMKGDRAFLDLGCLYTKVKSSLAYVSVRLTFPEPIVKGLVFTHVSQNWKPRNGKKEFYMEVLVKHPSLWRTYFPSFSVRDIVFNANIEIPGIWSEVFPRKFWIHFKEACIATLPETRYSERLRIERRLKGYFNGSAHAFLTAMQQAMWKFTNETIPKKFPKLIEVEPETFEVLDVRGEWTTVPISGVPTPLLMFPEKIQIRIRTSISKDTDFRSGHVIVNIKELRSIARSVLNEVRKSGKFWDQELHKVQKMLK